MSRITPARLGLIATGQTAINMVGDDGDLRYGLPKNYVVVSPGTTVNLDILAYAAVTISFDETLGVYTVLDSANGLAVIKTGDSILIRNSASNDQVVTVAAGNVAASFTTVQPLVDEVAGRFVKLYKRVAHTNNISLEVGSKLMWSQVGSGAEKCGVASDGLLDWYSVAKNRSAYTSVNGLTIVQSGSSWLCRITGGAALTQFSVGDVIIFTGFTGTNAVGGFVIMAVTVNGADLDLTLGGYINNTPAAEANGDNIQMLSDSIFNYAAAANVAGMGGYTDWRVPNIDEMFCMMSKTETNHLPDATAFPAFTTGNYWSSSRSGISQGQRRRVLIQADGNMSGQVSVTAPNYLILCRGGTL